MLIVRIENHADRFSRDRIEEIEPRIAHLYSWQPTCVWSRD